MMSGMLSAVLWAALHALRIGRRAILRHQGEVSSDDEELDLSVADTRLNSREIRRSRLQAVVENLARPREGGLMAGAAQPLVAVVRLQLPDTAPIWPPSLNKTASTEPVETCMACPSGSCATAATGRHWAPSGVRTACPSATGPIAPPLVRTSSSATPTTAAAAAVPNVRSQTRLVK